MTDAGAQASDVGATHIAVLGPMSLDLLPVHLPPELRSLPGYPAPIISSIINGYLDQGMRVTAITTSAGLNQTMISRGDGLTLAVVPRLGPRSALRMFDAERGAMLKVLVAEQPDVLHAHWSYEFAAAALDSRLPTLITVRDHAPTILMMTVRDGTAEPSDRFKRVTYRLLRLLLNNEVLRRGQHFSAPSPYMRDLMPSRRMHRTRVVPNFFSPSLQDHAVPLGCRDQRIITVSNGFGGRKNVTRALGAFARSPLPADGWVYELIGDQLGPGGPAEDWAQQHGLTAGVRFRGQVPYEEALEAVASASVMLHPSLEESFGMTVLEAMALGTPVVGGVQSGNVPELLREGAGLLCDMQSVESIAEALGSLTIDPELARKTAERGRVVAEASYSQDAAVASYLAYLTDIMRD